jgi:DNA-binding GntR family transcriptional regulator
LTDGEQVLAMTRLFCADGNPVILSYGAAPIRLLVEPAEQCNAELSLDDFIQRYYRRQISYTIFDIHTTMPGETLRNVLQLESGEPVLVLDQTFYDAANQPIFYSRGYFQDKIVRLRLVQAWK